MKKAERMEKALQTLPCFCILCHYIEYKTLVLHLHLSRTFFCAKSHGLFIIGVVAWAQWMEVVGYGPECQKYVRSFAKAPVNHVAFAKETVRVWVMIAPPPTQHAQAAKCHRCGWKPFRVRSSLARPWQSQTVSMEVGAAVSKQALVLQWALL